MGDLLERMVQSLPERWRERIREDLSGWSGPHAVLPAVSTYVLAAIGAEIAGVRLPGETEMGASTVVGEMGFVAVYTLFHGFLPVVLIGIFWRSLRGQIGFMAVLFLVTLYGFPVLLLASATGWIPLLGIAVQLLLEPRGGRAWVAIEYGSSSFCYMLFLMAFEGRLFPWGLPVLLFQAAVLLTMHLTARHLWMDPELDGVL